MKTRIFHGIIMYDFAGHIMLLFLIFLISSKLSINNRIMSVIIVRLVIEGKLNVSKFTFPDSNDMFEI